MNLALCAIASIVLVAIVALLIAFMQYQGRLIRAQPGITAGQLVYYVDTENKINEMILSIKDKAEALSKISQDVTIESVEIEFRIGRVCRIFGPDDVQIRACHDFLRRIPFERIPEEINNVKSEPANASRKPPGDTVSRGNLSTPRQTLNVRQIKDNFVKLMNNVKLNETPLTEIVEFYTTDLIEIAQKNEKYLLETDPVFRINYLQYQAACKYISDLMLTVKYRRFEIGGCRDVGNQAGYNLPSPNLPNSLVAPAAATGARGDGAARAAEPQDPARPAAAPDRSTQTPGPARDAGAAQGAGGPVADAALPAGASQRQAPPSQPSPAPASAAVQPGAGLTVAMTGGGPDLSLDRRLSSQADEQRDFELVSHYKFYHNISFGYLKDVLISPAEFLALTLVCFAGVLGALLRLILRTHLTATAPMGRDLLISPILGLITALVVYVLFRTGFVALTDKPQNDTSTISPFLIAFASLTAGLYSERAIDLLRRTSGNWLGGENDGQDRWAFGLKDRMTNPAEVASQLGVAEQLLQQWMNEDIATPQRYQRELALLLKVPVRLLFTDLGPKTGYGQA